MADAVERPDVGTGGELLEVRRVGWRRLLPATVLLVNLLFLAGYGLRSLLRSP